MPDDNKKKPVTSGRNNTTKGTPGERDTGAALRSIYQNTVEESVPDDLLDLLGKLG